MERSVNGMKLHREKYSGDFIPYNLPELFQGREKLEKLPGRELASSTTQSNHALLPTPPLPQASLTGWGSPNSDDWKKGLTLCLHCGLSKIREKHKKGFKNWPDYRCTVYNRYWEKIINVSYRYRIFDAGGHMIGSVHMKSCLAA
jgi:hypothetical protein